MANNIYIIKKEQNNITVSDVLAQIKANNIKTSIKFQNQSIEQVLLAQNQSIAEIIDSLPKINDSSNDNYVNIKDFGAKGDGITDDTLAFKNAIKKAYSKNIDMQSSAWINVPIIYIPMGSYKITVSIINSDMDIFGLRFIFIGDASQNTEIYFVQTEETYLFDNKGVFGRSIFRNISFVSNNTGKLLNLIGGSSTTGNAQSITFSNCFISKFKNIINSSYTGTATMCSEITFENCKLNSFDENSVLFNLGNRQGVNWRFVCTDIETYEGICFNYIEGQNVSIYQGSIIGLNNSVFVNIDSASDENAFGQGNAPHLIMQGSRFELRTFSKFYKCNNPSVKFEMSLYSCGMGGSNKSSLVDSNGEKSYVMQNIGRGHFLFDNCHNWGNYWIHSHMIFNSNGYLKDNNAYIEFKNNAPSFQTLSDNMTITEATGGSYYNIGANPTYNFINCGINTLIKLPLNNYLSKTNGYLYDNSHPREISKKILTIGCANNGFTVSGISSSNPSFSKTVSLPKGISLLSLKLIIEPGWTGGYSSNEFDISVTNYDGTFEFIKNSYVSKNGLILISDEFYRIKTSDGIKITWTATNNITSTYSCIAHIVLEY